MLAAFPVACLQTHLASRQEKRAIMTMMVFKLEAESIELAWQKDQQELLGVPSTQ
jgi:hypothetical protein